MDMLNAERVREGHHGFCYTILLRIFFLACVLTVMITFFLKKFIYPPNYYLRNTGSGKCSMSRVQSWGPKIWGYAAFYVTFYSIT